MIHPMDQLRPVKTQSQPVGETAASWFALGILAAGFLMLMKRQDKLEGGLGDSLLEKDVDPKELARGKRIELEHTRDPEIAREDPHYYSHLSLMEAKYKGLYRGNPLRLKEWDDYANKVADAYDARPSFEEKYIFSWEALMKHIEKMFKRMESKIAVEFVTDDPYKTTQEIIDDIQKNKRLKVYSGHAEHPVWTTEQNLKFRAYHDYLSHVAGGHEFGPKGEIASYNQHAKMAPKRALLALFTEIVGQALTAVKRGKFPEQKICKLHGFDYYNLGEIDETEYQKNFTRKNPSTAKHSIQNKIIEAARNAAREAAPTDNLALWQREAIDLGRSVRASMLADGNVNGDPSRYMTSDDSYRVIQSDEFYLWFRLGVEGHEDPEFVTAVRIGEIPKTKVSRNFRDQFQENGVSVLWIEGDENDRGDGTFEIFNDGKKIRIAGWRSPWRGSDGEPLLLSPKKLSDYTEDFKVSDSKAVKEMLIAAKAEKKKIIKLNPIPPASVAREAREGLKLRQSVAPSKRGGTQVGIARARQLANRQNISESTMKRMKSFFARHEIDKKAEGFAKGEKRYPSKGLQAWKLWGGDSGKTWVKKKI